MGKTSVAKTYKADKIARMLFYFCYAGLFTYLMYKTVPALEVPLWYLYKFSFYLLIPVSIFAVRKLPKKTLGIIAAILVPIVINKIITGSDDFLTMFLLILSARGIKFSNIVKYDLYMKIPALIILPIMYFSGLTDVYIHHRGEFVRHSMGFFNPNYFSSYLMSVVMEILYLRRDKIGWKEIVLTIASCGIIFYFTDSRTQIITMIFLGVALLVIKSRKIKHLKSGLMKFLVYNSAFILAVGSLGLSLACLDSSFEYKAIDRFTNGRIEMSVDAIREYGVSIIGNEKSANANLVDESIILDNVYIYIFSVHGALSLLLYCIFIRKYFIFANSNDEILLILIMFSFSVSGLTMRACMRPRFNIFLLYFAYMLYGSPEEEPKKIESKVDG